MTTKRIFLKRQKEVEEKINGTVVSLTDMLEEARKRRFTRGIRSS